ncbi:MAG TPA: UDP-N-acetylmuramate--L-alanine ligase [Paludibacteraceae bacterium]|jgi:UDP-N-acetylmuramate--alanine ligase|nr:UDP-N-acetylmuramate--L-alanine ligase [Paludibacteraceae bacterium]MBP9017018.1 UDP-N-acetylmuramate--L-alanine ligase [Paludibacteraceae bacterium]NLJ21096.1 UDP-N-acetylmuramate--L-alanine ligase [Bacteroidales bacterium]HOH54823.1 UDP-N-acetylmuramate--L-alanine ligase [Paludibacteraceae bacterium]
MDFTKYYFLGIGGMGMSALARYFNSKGFQTAGYDRVQSKVTADLQTEGIQINFDPNVDQIPIPFRYPENTLVVVTPAIPDDLPQLVYFRENGFTIKKRAEVLGDITRKASTICIAGTHGKTTTSTLTAHLLYQSHISCNAFLGGIANNYNSNLLLSKDSNLFVIEADEYDRSFHQLSPYMAVITSADPDHLDIYQTPEAYRESFEHFTSLISPGGILLMKKGVNIQPRLQKGVKQYSYSMNDGGDFYAENIHLVNHEFHFDFVTPSERISDIRLKIPIRINIENSVAAIALAWLNGVTKEEIRTAMVSYSGIYRRFNLVFRSEQTIFMDDYAHHPKELKASILSIKELFPGKKITGIFQPHLYSRTRDFALDFAEVLSLLDELILLDIYPAREEPIEGVSSEMIFRNVKLENKTLCSRENLLSLLKDRHPEVLVTFGAGDIDKLVPLIKKQLMEQTNGNA